MRIFLNFAVFLLFVLVGVQSYAQQKNGDKKTLYFQADKNGIQILAQKFEYTLLDAEKIRIGDILIDATTFGFQLIRNESDNSYSIRFDWPAGLLTDGQLILMNNNGKAIWSTQVEERQIKISAVSSEFANLRAELAVFTSEPVKADLINSMKFMPFMTFCISRGTSNTKIYLCSRELYLTAQGRNLTIKERSSTPKEATVEINGEAVGHQGIILLNKKDENIYFKASAASGAYLEIETRMKDVDFKDLVLSEDGKSLIITASGTEPAAKNKVVILGENLWQSQVDVNRPIIYLKGDGGIPMRQEFFARGNIPSEKMRLFLASDSVEQTYSSSVTVRGNYAPGTRVQTFNKEDTLRAFKSNKFEWDIRDLARGKKSQHYLNVESEGKKYVARYDVYRAYQNYLQGGLQYQTPSGVAYGYLQMQSWFENFIQKFQFGVELDANIHLTKKDNFPEYDELRAELLYKFKPGFQMQEDVWGVGLPLTMIMGKGFSSTTFGLSAFGLLAAPDSFPKWIKRYHPKLTYLLGGSGADIKIKSGLNASVHFLSPQNETRFLTYGLHYRSYTFDPSFSEEKGQFVLDLGYSFLF